MAEDGSSSKDSAPAGHGLRRAMTVDESRIRPPTNRLSSSFDGPTQAATRRRSSTFSTDSLKEVRKQFQSSTDDLLLPRASLKGHDEPSHWHSVPLAFALLPAVGGMLFQNGSLVVTDIMLLALGAIFLNWSVRLPWDWYHSAQSIRKREEHTRDSIFEDESGDDNHADLVSHGSLDGVPEDGPIPEQETKSLQRNVAHDKAVQELYIHEILALVSCFLFPAIGAYLLHSIRSYLSRPSEGLVSNYNLTIFLLASELRPMSHLVKLIQARTLHLQRVVNENPYDRHNMGVSACVQDLVRRVEELEARNSTREPLAANGTLETAMNGKQTALITTEVRRTLQPELDALNRAVRRYEKRATLQTMQTESRLLDIEARLADAITLAAAAAQNGQRQRNGLWSMLIEWVASGVVLPLQAFGALVSMPFRTIIAIVEFGKATAIGTRHTDSARKATTGRPGSHTRIGADRLQGKGLKR